MCEVSAAMAKSCLIVMILAGLVCVGKQHDADQEMREVLEARLSTVEAVQKTMREKVKNAQQMHVRDMNHMVEFCEELKATVEQQTEILQDIRESLQNNGSSEGVAGPCAEGNYLTINDSNRVTIDRGRVGDLCDRSLQPGWYRFFLDHSNAVIPTVCVPEHRCETEAPMWLELRDQPLPEEGQEMEAIACASFDHDCCYWEYPIMVRNCGDYFVYKITPPSECNVAFCAERQG